MKIGLVLSRPPSYSETFFNSKIMLLLEKGFEIELFVDTPDPDFKLCPQHSLPKTSIISATYNITKTLLLHPFRSIRIIKYELQRGIGFAEAMRNFYKCLHLLNSHNLQWVHFGFAATSIGREHMGKVLRARMGVSFRGYDISRFPLNKPHVYEVLWKNVTKVHSISDALYQKALKLGLEEYPDVEYMKITPAINAAAFKTEKVTAPFQEPVRLLTVARLHWSKGLDYTIEALKILKSKGVNFKYTIVGDGHALERLLFISHEAGLSDHITFAGTVAHEKLPHFYHHADIYIQYSVQEGFCNSVLEAQASGLPCIVSDAEGLPENIIHNQTGYVVPSRNPEALSEKIREVINMSSSERAVITKNATERVESEFNFSKQKSLFTEFFLI